MNANHHTLPSVPGIVDLESSLDTDTPEYRLVVDRARAADLGVSIAAVAQTVRLALEVLCTESGVRFIPHDVQVQKVGAELAVSFHCAMDAEVSIAAGDRWSLMGGYTYQRERLETMFSTLAFVG